MNSTIKYIGLCLGLALFLETSIIAQGKVHISGSIRDSITKEVLIGANVINKTSMDGCNSDIRGYYSFFVEIPAEIEFSFVGYKKKTIFLNDSKDQIKDIELARGASIGEVVVNYKVSSYINKISISSEQLSQIPAMGAKPDLIKSLQLYPGIDSHLEGSSLLMVRGGDPGQNQYLFDNVPIIYVHHLGGFMSVFNPEIINSVEVYKGGFPSRYGGKLSSILNISQKEGDNSQLKGTVSLGLTDASFSIEGPIKKGKSTFIISGRKTLIDGLMLAASSISDGGDYKVAYGFHDINGKYTWKPNTKQKLSVNLYYGDDYLKFWSKPKSSDISDKNSFLNAWGNWMASVNYRHIFSSNLTNHTTLSTTRYRLKDKAFYSYKTDNTTNTTESVFLSTVQSSSLRSNIKYYATRWWSLEAGVLAQFQSYAPNSISYDNVEQSNIADPLHSLELTPFVENHFSIGSQLVVVGGIRAVSYFSDDYYNFSPEPRFRMDFKINSSQMLNLSYHRVSQSSHLLYTSGDIMNNEIWVPANNVSPVATSNQYSLAWTGSFYNGDYRAEVIAYYKDLNKLTTYKEAYASIIGDQYWERKLEHNGLGKSYGLEAVIKKETGDLKGFLSYSLSRSTRRYPGINSGNEFLFDYDRTHKISLSLNYYLSSKLKFGLSWIYQTGLPYTPALGMQLTPQLDPRTGNIKPYYEAMIYGERNSDRMRDYHRMDVGLTYNTLTKRRKRKAEWTFSIYNLYNRHNPYYYYYGTDSSLDIFNPEYEDINSNLELYQVSYFPVIPSISYKVYFDGTAIKREKSKISLKQKLSNWLYYENKRD